MIPKDYPYEQSTVAYHNVVGRMIPAPRIQLRMKEQPMPLPSSRKEQRTFGWHLRDAYL
jgi:hypothetical protein